MDPLKSLIAELTRLPGIGEKTALRLALHLLRGERAQALSLAGALRLAAERIRLCSTCLSFTEADPCAICSDARRDGKSLCVVEGVADLLAIERTHEFRGRYHVLHGVLSPLDGIGPEALKIGELLRRVRDGGVDEVIVATNADVEGEATALYLTRLLKPLGLKISRIAQGVPMGGDLEFADQVTLARAIAGRRDL